MQLLLMLFTFHGQFVSGPKVSSISHWWPHSNHAWVVKNTNFQAAWISFKRPNYFGIEIIIFFDIWLTEDLFIVCEKSKKSIDLINTHRVKNKVRNIFISCSQKGFGPLYFCRLLFPFPERISFPVPPNYRHIQVSDYRFSIAKLYAMAMKKGGHNRCPNP